VRQIWNDSAAVFSHWLTNQVSKL